MPQHSVFGHYNHRTNEIRSSMKERGLGDSEAWSAAILPGSGDAPRSEYSMQHVHIRWFLGLTGLAITVLLGQLFHLQVVQGARNQALADGNRVRQNVIRAPRGAIYDRKGTLLVRNVANFDLIIIPARLPKKEAERQEVYSRLSVLIQRPPEELRALIDKAGAQSPLPVLVQENVSRDMALAIEEKIRDLPGVDLDTNPVREYVENGLLSHFLGYTGRVSAEDLKAAPDYRPTDFIGKLGVERAYEKDLRGENGAEQTEVDATGKPIKVLAAKDPTAGNSLKLSIDFGLEKAMSEALTKQAEGSGGKRGAAVALNPRNGQILAAANYPSYDNNLFARGIKQSDYSSLLNDPNNPLFNKVTSGGYPIGSTVKPFISAAALQEKIIDTSTVIEDKGKIEVPNIYDPSIVYTFKGWESRGLGPVNIFKAIALSSDVFYYTVGGGYQGFRGLGVTKLLQYYEKFGFGQKTGLDIGDESAGYLPSPDKKKKASGESWELGDTYNISIGQGNMMASPLQLATALGAIANGGTIYKPQLVSEIVDENGQTVRKLAPQVARSGIVAQQYLDIVRQGMRQTMEPGGTGCCSTTREVPVPVSGKTGTAETSSEGLDGKNARTKPHAWFEAYAPSDNPEIVVVALVEYSGEGAQFALPVVRDTLKYYFTTGKQ